MDLLDLPPGPQSDEYSRSCPQLPSVAQSPTRFVAHYILLLLQAIHFPPQSVRKFMIRSIRLSWYLACCDQFQVYLLFNLEKCFLDHCILARTNSQIGRSHFGYDQISQILSARSCWSLSAGSVPNRSWCLHLIFEFC